MQQMDTSPQSSPRREPIVQGVDNKGTVDIQLDFSWFHMSDLNEITNEQPRPCLKGTQVRNDESKFDARCLKLSNNVLQDISFLPAVLETNLIHPMAISWLDLSFNELPKIDSVLLQFSCLKILYLHGNLIKEIEEIDKLQGLGELYKLSLHGNPFATDFKGYRLCCISKLPQLHYFDFSLITRSERISADSWSKKNPMKKKKKKREEE